MQSATTVVNACMISLSVDTGGAVKGWGEQVNATIAISQFRQAITPQVLFVMAVV
jgi:hypothetical protein